MSDNIQEAAPAADPAVTPTENQEAAPTLEKEVVQQLAAKPEADLSKAEKNLIKKYKIKVDGQEYEESIDLNDEESIKKHLQLSKAAQKRMKESTELRKAAEDFLDVLKKDPRRIMKELGVNEKELAQIIMNEELADLEKSPEQKEIERLQRELSQIQESKKKEEEERKSKDYERLKVEAEQKIETDISAALELGGVAKTPYTVKKMAEMMYIALENDIDLRPQDVVPLVKKQLEQDIKELFAASSDDVLEEMLKDQMPRIRKRNVAKSKQVVPAANQIKETSTNEPVKKEEVRRLTIAEFMKNGMKK